MVEEISCERLLLLVLTARTVRITNLWEITRQSVYHITKKKRFSLPEDASKG